MITFGFHAFQTDPLGWTRKREAHTVGPCTVPYWFRPEEPRNKASQARLAHRPITTRQRRSLCHRLSRIDLGAPYRPQNAAPETGGHGHRSAAPSILGVLRPLPYLLSSLVSAPSLRYCQLLSPTLIVAAAVSFADRFNCCIISSQVSFHKQERQSGSETCLDHRRTPLHDAGHVQMALEVSLQHLVRSACFRIVALGGKILHAGGSLAADVVADLRHWDERDLSS
jgi:hypothetical protein